MALSLILRVGDTSAQDVSLVSGGVFINNYAMNSPDVSQQALQNLGDGNGLSVPAWSNVTESIDIHISAASALLVADKIKAIERLLDLARQSTTGWLDDRLYLLAQFAQDTEAWRSQILAAKLQLHAPTDHIWHNYATGTIILTRRYYWETEAVKAIAMTSGPTGTPTTGYVTVYNADDTHATNRNWFQMAADQIEGSIPAPAKLNIKNNSGSARAIGTLYLGNYVFANPTTVDPIFRAEDLAGSDTTIDTTETNAFYWSLANGNLTDAFKGQFGRVIAVFSDRPEPTTLLRAALQFRGLSPVIAIDLALGEQVLASVTDYLVDLGGIPIPPGGFWTNIGTSLYLAIKGRAATGTDTVGIDWAQVFPSGAGRYRVIKSIFNNDIENGDEIIDDGPEDAVYGVISGDNVPLYRPYFSPLYLWPGKINRLRMIIGGGVVMEAGQAWQVKATYRPRRLSL